MLVNCYATVIGFFQYRLLQYLIIFEILLPKLQEINLIKIFVTDFVSSSHHCFQFENAKNFDSSHFQE